MSTRRFCALADECLPALELMEPRILLSADCVTPSPLDQPPPPSNPPLHVDVQPAESGRLSVIRRDVLDLASAVATRKAENPNADVIALSVPGYSTINADGDIKVRIRFAPDREDILAALTSGGFRAGSFHQSQGSTTGWVSYANLEAIAEITGVKEISFAIPPVTNSDPIVSVGDTILHVEDLRNFKGVDGTGIKIGVISDGAADWEYIESYGELPEIIHIHPGHWGGANMNEGTAMMEIIHDLAPEATLYFSGPTDYDEMQDSIAWLVAQGCDVIVDDLSFFDQPFFQDGDVAQTVMEAVNGMTIDQTPYDPVVYVTAAGNYCGSHYQGEFDGDENNFNTFAGAGWGPFPLTPPEMLFFGVEQYQTVRGYLQWNDEWGYSGNDYDLYLYKYVKVSQNPEEWEWVEWSNSSSTQDGDDNPFESVTVTGTDAAYTWYGWKIKKTSGSDRVLELYMYGAQISQWQGAVLTDSIFGQGAADGVITVGAVMAGGDNDEIEGNCSRSSSTVYAFDNHIPISYDTRNSLDVVAVDRVRTKTTDEGYLDYLPDSMGIYNFSGTSAAAPHVAAIAALLKDIDSNYTPSQIVALINDHAVDLGDSGYDDVFGYGRVDALAIITSAAPGTVTLAAGSDTGASYEDSITKLDNSESGKELEFVVEGVTAGATVKVYADDVEIGWAVVEEGHTSVTVATNDTVGTVVLAEGTNVITATQTEVGLYHSAPTSGLTITVDTVAPTVLAFARYYQGDDWELHPTTLDTITVTFSEDVYDTLGGGSVTLYNLSTSQGVSASPSVSYDYPNDTATWDFDELDLTEYAGWYLVTISGTYLADIAGNAMGSDYTYGASSSEMIMLLPILGDANLDGEVEFGDLIILTSHWQETGSWEDGDFNYDNVVEFGDLIILTDIDHWQQSLTR